MKRPERSKQPDAMQQPAMRQPEEMDGFERALMRAMRRVEVRPETAAKLLAIAAVAEQEQRRARGHAGRWRTGGRLWVWPRPAQWMGGALAATLVLIAAVVGGVEHHDRVQQRSQAERDFALSLQITQQALAQTRQRLRQAGVQLDQ